MKLINTWEVDRCDVCGEKIPVGTPCVTTSPRDDGRGGYEFLAHEICYDHLMIAGGWRVAEQYRAATLTPEERAQFERARFEDEQTQKKSFIL